MHGAFLVVCRFFTPCWQIQRLSRPDTDYEIDCRRRATLIVATAYLVFIRRCAEFPIDDTCFASARRVRAARTRLKFAGYYLCSTVLRNWYSKNLELARFQDTALGAPKQLVLSSWTIKEAWVSWSVSACGEAGTRKNDCPELVSMLSHPREAGEVIWNILLKSIKSQQNCAENTMAPGVRNSSPLHFIFRQRNGAPPPLLPPIRAGLGVEFVETQCPPTHKWRGLAVKHCSYYTHPQTRTHSLAHMHIRTLCRGASLWREAYFSH